MQLLMYRAPLALSLVLFSGCSIYGGGAVVSEQQPEPGEIVPGGSAPELPSVPVAPYADLLRRAEVARDAGHYEEALVQLERAQRIDPTNAAIYLSLAQTHWARGARGQARATAERGLLYCDLESQCAALARLAQ